MLLLLTHTQGYESDLIVEGLRNRGISFVRFNLDDFPNRNKISFTAGKDDLTLLFSTPKKSFFHGDVRFAWMQQPYSHSFSELPEPQRTLAKQETQHFLTGIWEIVEWQWMSHPSSLRRNNKVRQLRLAQQVGFEIPNSLVSSEQTRIREFCRGNSETIFKNLDTPLLYKEDGTYLASYTKELNIDLLDKQPESLHIPMFFQEKIEKFYELRILIFGGHCFGVRINSQKSSLTDLDWRKNPEVAQTEMERFDVPDQLKLQCQKLLELLQLGFGAFDFIVTEDEKYIFLEVNSTGSWYWMEVATDQAIHRTLIDYLHKHLG